LNAKTTSYLLEKSLLPLAARLELAEFIDQLHNKQSSYISNMLCRITGTNSLQIFEAETMYTSLESAEVQLSKELQEDNSLFVEEEQNLFIDEVRETELWCKMLEKASLRYRKTEEIEMIWIRPFHELMLWVLNGLKTLNTLLKTEDGALGWTSKPAVFAICMRIILCTNVVLSQTDGSFPALIKNMDGAYHSFEEITTALQEFVTLGREKKVHESLLYAVR